MWDLDDISIDVHTDFAPIRDGWLALQSDGISTLYQTYEWCSTWFDAIGKTSGIEPQIVTGRDGNGRLVFILPFCINQHGGYRVIEWMAPAIATYGFGVYDQSFISERDALIPYWPRIVSELASCDAIWLRHLPVQWRGVPHPLGRIFTTQSANQTHQITLRPDYDELYVKKRSPDSRRKAKKRDERLLAAGKVTFGSPQTRDAGDTLIDQTIAQHTEHLAARGVHKVLEDGAARFLKQMSKCDQGSAVSILPQYLLVDDELVAAKIGFVYDGVYWAMISSLGGQKALKKFSPGDFALREIIQACCDNGLELFDFATGDSTYKQHWCDSSVALHEIISARTARGMLWVAAKRAAIDTKRVIKNSPYLWTKLSRLRQVALGGKS